MVIVMPIKKTENTNFALLVSKRFTEPFNEPIQYGQHVARLANMLAGGVTFKDSEIFFREEDQLLKK